MKVGRWIKICILTALFAGLLFFTIEFGKKMMQAMLPLGIGIAIAYILLPLIDYLDKFRLSRTLSIILSITFSIIIILIILVWLIPILINNIKDLTEVLPEIFDSAFNSFVGFIEKNTPTHWQQEIMKELDNMFSKVQEELMKRLYSFISQIPKSITFIIDILVGWIISFYILKDKELIVRNLKYMFPKSYREEMICFLRDIHRVVLRFIQGQVLIAIIIGIIEMLGLYIARIPYAPLLGFIGGMSNIIPYFGPYIGAVPALVVALTISPYKALWTVVIFVIVQQIDNVILSPRIIKGKLGLHPVTTIMAVLVGGRLFGFFGLVLAVPFVAMLKIIIKKVYRIVSG